MHSLYLVKFILFKMSDLKLWVNTRKHYRCQITKLHNDLGNWPSLDETEKLVKKSKLLNIKVEIKQLNDKIQAAKFSGDDNEDDLTRELDDCESYGDKLNACLAVIESSNSNPGSFNGGDQRQSLLKSPVVPLPNFSGDDNEDLTKFLTIFDETLNRLNYKSFDKFLVLKQQLKGRALVLINSLEVDRLTKMLRIYLQRLLHVLLISDSIQLSN